MDAKDVREEIATRLRTIEGLNVSAWPIPTPIPPVAVVVPRGVTYDQTYGRGSDEMNYNVLVFIGKPNDRSSSDRLDEYVSGSGSRSIKAVLEAGTYTAFDYIHVVSAEWDVVSVNGNEYLTAIFDLTVIGRG